MPKFTLPQNRTWQGIYPGEFLGNLFLTKNIDLYRSPVKIMLGESLSSIFDSGDDSDLTLPVKFLRTAADGTDKWWALAGKLFKTTGTDPETGWIQDAISNSPSAPADDMVELVDILYVPTATNIARLSAGTWTASWWQGTQAQAALTSNPHRFEVFAGAWLMTDGRLIHTWDNTLVVNSAITLPADFIALWIRSNADFSFIGTRSTTGREAEVFFWDRTSTVFNARYGIGDREALAGFAVSGIPFVITKRGEIKRFTGQGFRTVQQFPTVELGKDIRNIDPNGISVNEGIVKINVDMGISADLRVLSGIWTFNADTNNLIHSNSFKNDSGLDYSQQEVAGAGAMVATQPGQGRFLVGGSAYTTYPSATKHCIFTFDEESTINRGYILTPKLRTQDVQGFFKNLFLKFPRFKSSGDRIRILALFRDSIILPVYETITWVTSTTFTGSSTLVGAGDFVEIIAGDNAGAIAKITGRSGSSAPYTFTIDLTLNSSTKAARARYLKFAEVGTIADQDSQRKVFRLGARSEWQQYLIELRGTDRSPALEELLLEFDEHKF